MNNLPQRELFLQGECDAWFERNRYTKSITDPSEDLLLPTILDIDLEYGPEINVVEVGCGKGLRLEALNRLKGWTTYGLDPSPQAVNMAKEMGAHAEIGTAEKLPYKDQSMDLRIFGFCLYLVDRDDLFAVAA